LAYLYDERGHQLATVGISGGEVYGCAGNTLSVKRGSLIYLYNEKGRQTGTTSAR